jgi:RNA polymerase sigma-70 factor (ECF subfamily)
VTNQQLAASAQAGSMAAFEQLCRRFQVRWVHYLRQKTGSLQTAEDLVQETLLEAFRNLQSYDSTWRFSTWVFTIARWSLPRC